MASTRDAAGFGAVVRDACSATALPATTADATATGAPAAVAAGLAPGTKLELGEAPAHAVAAAAATRQPSQAKPRRNTLRPRIDAMAPDARPAIPRAPRHVPVCGFLCLNA